MIRAVLLAVLTLFASNSTVGAGNVNNHYKLAIHILPHETRSCAKNQPVITRREDITDSYGSCGGVDVFPVAFQLDEITGIQFGLTWPDMWGTCAFSPCTDLKIGNIIEPGDGIAMTWFECKLFWSVIPGFATLTAVSSGEIAFTENPVTGRLSVSDCGFQEAEPDSVFSGSVTCENAAASLTWGLVKAMFR